MDTIGFVGGGNMAEAMIRGVINAHVYQPENIFVSDIRQKRLKHLARKYRIHTTGNNVEVAGEADILVLSIKPQNMTEALASIKGCVKHGALVISIVAGKKVGDISSVLGNVAIIRVMPNTPALIDEGASALFANSRAKPRLEKARLIFLSVGDAVIVNNEDLIDAVTAVSGTGPAYFFLLMHEMIKAGVELGLGEDLSKELVLQTAKGAALLAEQSAKDGETPAELSKKVATPGGTTEAAFKVFSDGKFGPLVSAAIKRACERSHELSST